MCSTIEDLVNYTLSLHIEEEVRDVRIGLGYTAVKLSSGKCGVAGILRHRLNSGTCSLLPQAGTLAGSNVSELILLARSQKVVETSVGLAAINALAMQEWEHSSQEELFELLGITGSDQVGMIGFIEPVARKIQRRTKSVFVFDEAKSDMNGVTEIQKLPAILPRCDVVILSATCLVNNTFDALMALSSRAREVCLMGPSTPLFPDFFRNKGVTLLAGRQITDPDKLLQIVSEAGGTKRFGKVTKKITLVLSKE